MKKRFRIGISFSTNIRGLVRNIAGELLTVFKKDQILFDEFHKAEFARGDLALYLPKLYAEDCDLIVAVFDSTYSKKDWTGLEWRAIYSRQKSQDYQSVMLLSVGHDRPEGLFSLDGTANISDWSPSSISELILQRLALNEGYQRDHYKRKLIPDTDYDEFESESVVTRDSILEGVRDELYLLRRERSGRARQKGLKTLADRLEESPDDYPGMNECRVLVWKQLLTEARSYSQFYAAASGLRQVCNKVLGVKVVEQNRWPILRAVSEAAIDLSQLAPLSFESNQLAALLNSVVRETSRMIGMQPESTYAPFLLGEVFATRARCRRAMAMLLHRRMQSSAQIASKVKRLRCDALDDARRATKAKKNSFTLMELALALFVNSSSPTSEPAVEAMRILESLVKNQHDVLAGYEYMRQLKIRHRYSDAVRHFYVIEKNENDRRRFHANLNLFATCVIGLDYSRDEAALLNSAVFDAIVWVQGSIASHHHRAQDIVDYCFLRAINGGSLENIVSPLKELNNGDEIDWNLLIRLAREAATGVESLDQALLLGLEDARVWGRIGTLYADFIKDFGKAIAFYDQAIHLDPHSPLHHFNKARVLANGLHDYPVARSSLRHARRLRRNMWGWFKMNKTAFDELATVIERNTTQQSPELVRKKTRDARLLPPVS